MCELNIERDIDYLSLELSDGASMARALGTPVDEICDLAGQSSVSACFEQPLYTAKVNALAVREMRRVFRILPLPQS